MEKKNQDSLVWILVQMGQCGHFPFYQKDLLENNQHILNFFSVENKARLEKISRGNINKLNDLDDGSKTFLFLWVMNLVSEKILEDKIRLH